MHRMNAVNTLINIVNANPIFIFNNKKIVVIDQYLSYSSVEKFDVDVIIISKNAPLQLEALMQTFHCKQIVFDASNSLKKVNKWKAEAANLGLTCFSVVDNGAFVMNTD